MEVINLYPAYLPDYIDDKLKSQTERCIGKAVQS